MPNRARDLILPPKPNLAFEEALWKAGLTIVAGVDEAGRGAWAGPVYAGAVVLPNNDQISSQLIGVNDSKKCTPKQRESLALKIKQASACWGIGCASAQEIDQYGIVSSTRMAMMRALEGLNGLPCHVLIDYMTIPDLALPQTSLVKGDARSLSIAAASILAKTARDEVMRNLDLIYPGYGFSLHKGYGTRLHQSALESIGPCAAHRKSFAPIEALLQ